jgi:hypothetical protein
MATVGVDLITYGFVKERNMKLKIGKRVGAVAAAVLLAGIVALVGAGPAAAAPWTVTVCAHGSYGIQVSYLGGSTDIDAGTCRRLKFQEFAPDNPNQPHSYVVQFKLYAIPKRVPGQTTVLKYIGSASVDVKAGRSIFADGTFEAPYLYTAA